MHRRKNIPTQGQRDARHLTFTPGNLVHMSDMVKIFYREQDIATPPELASGMPATVMIHLSTDEDHITLHCALYDDNFAPFELDMVGSTALVHILKRTPALEKFFLKGLRPYYKLKKIPEDAEKINELDNTWVHYSEYFTRHFGRNAFVDIATKRDIYLDIRDDEENDDE